MTKTEDINVLVEQHTQQLKDCAGHLNRAQQQFAVLNAELKAGHKHDTNEVLKQEIEALKRALQEERTAKVLIEQELRLGDAQRVASQARWRVSGTMLFLGTPMMFIGIFNLIGRFYGLYGDPNTWGYWGTLVPLGVLLLILAPLPSDDIAIRVAGASMLLFLAQVFLLYGSFPVLSYSGTYCAFDEESCPTIANAIGAIGLAALIIFVFFVPRLLKLKPDVEHAALLEVWVWTCEQFGTVIATVIFGMQFWLVPWAVVQHERGALAVSPSDALPQIHKLVRLLSVCVGIAYIGSYLIADPAVQADPAVISMLFHGVLIGVGVVFVLSPDNVSRLRSFLSSFQVSEQARSAAGVASLVGNMGATKALALAKELFGALPFSSLSSRDLATNEDTGLNQHVVPAKLGEVDAFFSHSWSDSAKDKWAALEEWASDFAAQHNRFPLLWLGA